MVASFDNKELEMTESSKKGDHSSSDRSRDSDQLNHGQVSIIWTWLKTFMNLLVWIVGLINAPLDAKGRIPWDDEDPQISGASVEDLVAKVKKGRVTSTRLVTYYLKRVRRINPMINAVVDMASEEALKKAASIDEAVAKINRGDSDADFSLLEKPLLGIPFSCKDSIGVEGLLQTGGCVARKATVAKEDAAVIRTLRSRGAIPLAITNVPEILLWWDTSNVVFGRTNNPYDLSRIAGGSSGGEAALIASEGIAFGVGSDMGGSIRIPSFYCGVFGHKASPRLVPTSGMWPVFPEALNEYVSFGPMARKARDLKLLVKSMMDESMAKKTRLDEPVDLSKINILWFVNEPGNPLTSPPQKEVVCAIEDAVKALAGKHKVAEKKVSFRDLAYSLEMWSVAIRQADPRGVKNLLEEVTGRQLNVEWELFKSLLGLSDHSFNTLFLCLVQRLLDAPSGSKRHKRLLNMFSRVRKQVLESLGDNGVLICSTMPETAPKHCSTPFKGTETSLAGAFNFLSLPATQVPIRLSRDGLPIGLQVASAPYNDHLCLAVAESLEEIFGGYKRP